MPVERSTVREHRGSMEEQRKSIREQGRAPTEQARAEEGQMYGSVYSARTKRRWMSQRAITRWLQVERFLHMYVCIEMWKKPLFAFLGRLESAKMVARVFSVSVRTFKSARILINKALTLFCFSY